jgi:hypothetical protein
MTELDKINLIRDVYSVVYPNVASLYHDGTGSDLAYIVAAIIDDKRCELTPFSMVVKLLKAEFGSFHIIWNYIIVEPSVLCVNCDKEILLAHASFCPPLFGWLGHYCCIDNDVNAYAEYEIIGG